MATQRCAAPGGRTASTPPRETPSCWARISRRARRCRRRRRAAAHPATWRSSSTIPLHDPLLGGHNGKGPGNTFPRWMRPASMRPGDQGGCGGTGVASAYFLLEPTDTNLKNNIPASKAFVAQVNGTAYHLQNVALLPWYTGASEGLGSTYSFPDAQALAEPAKPCPARGRRRRGGSLPAHRRVRSR